MTTNALSVDEVLAAAAGAPPYVAVERFGDRAVVRLEDPDKLNVLSGPLVLQLHAALGSLTGDREIRSIVITGAGRAFCTGGDLRLMHNATQRLHDPADVDGSTGPWRFIRRQFGDLVRRIATCDAAVIAAVNGPAAGVGLAIVLSCDLAVASENAVLVPAFGRLGLLPEVGTSWFLTRRLGHQRAFEFYVGGKHVDAQEALRLGLVNEVVPHGELLDAALRWCDRVSETPPHAVPMAKPLLRGAADMSWEQALLTEEFAEPNCFTTRGFAERVEALLERR